MLRITEQMVKNLYDFIEAISFVYEHESKNIPPAEEIVKLITSRTVINAALEATGEFDIVQK